MGSSGEPAPPSGGSRAGVGSGHPPAPGERARAARPPFSLLPRAGGPETEETRKRIAEKGCSVLPLPQRKRNSEVLPEPPPPASAWRPHAGRVGRGEAGPGLPPVAPPAAVPPALPACHFGGLVHGRRPEVTARNYEVATGAGSPIAASVSPLRLRRGSAASFTFSCRCFLTLIPPLPSAPSPPTPHPSFANSDSVSYRTLLVPCCTPAPETAIKTRSCPSSRQSLHRRRRKTAKTAQAASGGGARSSRKPPETPPHAPRSAPGTGAPRAEEGTPAQGQPGGKN